MLKVRGLSIDIRSSIYTIYFDLSIHDCTCIIIVKD